MNFNFKSMFASHLVTTLIQRTRTGDRRSNNLDLLLKGSKVRYNEGGKKCRIAPSGVVHCGVQTQQGPLQRGQRDVQEQPPQLRRVLHLRQEQVHAVRQRNAL